MRTALRTAVAAVVSLSCAFAQTAPNASSASPPPDVPQGEGATVGNGAEISMPGIRKLTIGGQYRLRYENLYNYDFNNDAGTNTDYFLQRIRLNLGLEFNDQIEAFFQIQDSRFWGQEPPISPDSPGLDFHQGYVNIHDMPFITGDTRLGRQAVSRGAQRLIGALEWLNQGRAFDGLLQTWNFEEKHSIDLFFFNINDALRPVQNEDAWFVGMYGTAQLSDETKGELYVLLLNNEETAAGGNEHRFTLGTNWGFMPGDWDIGAEIATQVGEVDNNDIPIGETYAGHLHAQFNAQGDAGFWAKAGLDLASGDDPNTMDDERFNNLFPTAHAHWGMMDLALWENLVDPYVQVGFKPGAPSRLSATWHHFQADQAGDVFGGPNGIVSTGVPGGSKTMGNEIDLLFSTTLDTAPIKTILQIGYGIFLPGAGAKEANGGSDDPAHFFYVSSDFRF